MPGKMLVRAAPNFRPDAKTDIAKRVSRLRHLRAAKLPLSMDPERLLAIFDDPTLYDAVDIELCEMAGKGSPNPSSRASCADPSPKNGTPARD